MNRCNRSILRIHFRPIPAIPAIPSPAAPLSQCKVETDRFVYLIDSPASELDVSREKLGVLAARGETSVQRLFKAVQVIE